MKQILFNAGFLRESAVILNKGEIEDYFVEHDFCGGGTGNIYKGRVDNIVPGMQAAFIDIGLEKNAFLYAGDIDSSCTDIRKLIKKGDDITVQIIKEAQGVKGARVTSKITLPGHKLVLMPHTDYVGVSKKIADENEKQRLKSAVEECRGENGYIVRTEAANSSKEELEQEIRYLEGLWAEISKNAKTKNSPCLLFDQEELLLSLIRDRLDASVDKLIINDEYYYKKAIETATVLVPEHKHKIEFKQGDPFAAAGIEAKLKKLLSRCVWLDNGAYLIIDYTEALTVIDVNTGKFTGDYDLERTIVKTNLLAAKEIARQMRLRSMGGIIIVDFIDMQEQADRDAVLSALEEAVKDDSVKTNILGFAPLGLVEITRKKSRLPLCALMQATCPYCEGDGRILSKSTVLENILKELYRLKTLSEEKTAVIRVNPVMCDELKKWEKREKFSDIKILVRQDAGMHIEDFNITLVSSLADEEGLIKIQ